MLGKECKCKTRIYLFTLGLTFELTAPLQRTGLNRFLGHNLEYYILFYR
jgi:hypothetical protein